LKKEVRDEIETRFREEFFISEIYKKNRFFYIDEKRWLFWDMDSKYWRYAGDVEINKIIYAWFYRVDINPSSAAVSSCRKYAASETIITPEELRKYVKSRVITLKNGVYLPQKSVFVNRIYQCPICQTQMVVPQLSCTEPYWYGVNLYTRGGCANPACNYSGCFAFVGAEDVAETDEVPRFMEFKEFNYSDDDTLQSFCSMNYVPRTFNPEARVEDVPELFMEMLDIFEFGKGVKSMTEHPWRNQKEDDGMRMLTPSDKELFTRFLVNMAHLNTSDRLMMFLVGNNNAGKSPMMKCIRIMFGATMVGSVSIANLGENGGTQICRDKKIWMQEDASMGFATNQTLELIKSNYSDEALISNRVMYSGWGEIEGERFLIGADNQLFKIPADYDCDAFYKRACPVVCPNQFESDAEFEKKVIDPIFLDQLYSWLLVCEENPVRSGFEHTEFIKRNESIWKWSAYPVKRICDQLFEKTYDINSKYHELQLFQLVDQEFVKQQAIVPSRLNAKVREYLVDGIGCGFTRIKGVGYFIGIQPRDESTRKLLLQNTVDAETIQQTLY